MDAFSNGTVYQQASEFIQMTCIFQRTLTLLLMTKGRLGYSHLEVNNILKPYRTVSAAVL